MAHAARIVSILVAVLGAAALAPSAAQAEIFALTQLEFPSTVKAGQTGVSATLALVNANTPARASFGLKAAGDHTVCNAGDPAPCVGPGIVLTPSCSQGAEGGCEAAGADAGVFAFAPTATGRPGSACAGMPFDVSQPAPVTGQLVVRPQVGNVVIPAGTTCRIDLTFAVLRMPTGDFSGDPGVQTGQFATAAQVDGGELAVDDGLSTMTVEKATPAVATSASPGTMLGAGALSHSVTLSGVLSPADQPVEFRLYGPGDPSCSNAIFTTTVPMSDAGTATSAPYMPPAPGVYRWRALYAGDANNQPAASACGDPGGAALVATPAAAAGAETGPEILGVSFSRAPRVGENVFLEIRAKDPLRPISGVQVDFGETRGLTGISACRLPSFGAAVTPQLLRIPRAFRRPGVHSVTITVLAGSCATPIARTVRTISVTVLPRAAARAAFTAPPLAARSAAATPSAGPCPGRLDIARNTALSLRKAAKAVLCVVNRERTKRGLRRLVRSPLLTKAATNHSKDMLRRRYFDHVGPSGPEFTARLRRVRYKGLTAAENIGYGSDFNADLLVRSWMNSPGHRANILRRQMGFAGVGAVVGLPVTPRTPGTTYTMVFGKTLR